MFLHFALICIVWVVASRVYDTPPPTDYSPTANEIHVDF